MWEPTVCAHTPPTLRTLLESAVDYAGIFPPATLSLPDALRDYASARAGTQTWLLGRFVLSAATLEEVERLAPQRSAQGSRK